MQRSQKARYTHLKNLALMVKQMCVPRLDNMDINTPDGMLVERQAEVRARSYAIEALAHLRNAKAAMDDPITAEQQGYCFEDAEAEVAGYLEHALDICINRLYFHKSTLKAEF